MAREIKHMRRSSCKAATLHCVQTKKLQLRETPLHA